MDIDKKKKLAELINIVIIGPLHTKYGKGHEYEGQYHTDGMDWNPSDNDTQFIEVIRALSFQQRIDVSCRLPILDTSTNAHNDDDLEMLLWLIDNKDKVLDSILEVVNND